MSTHPRAPEDVVRGFLGDVRSGRRLDLAGRYLAPRIRAHQGRPGSAPAVVERSPGQYAAHVREMLRAVGPWTFEVLDVTDTGGLVEATWRQTGAVGQGPDRGRPVVEHGHAGYVVQDGRITEYWIEFRQETAPG
ncbi:MAG TPA: nuclear transport factor 2 family protein [Geodermatophilus sp.]|nr:nuclear transport factor 2 family protein [Geodermatophilus sp.]